MDEAFERWWKEDSTRERLGYPYDKKLAEAAYLAATERAVKRIAELEQQLEDEICIREVVGQQVVELRTALEIAKVAIETCGEYLQKDDIEEYEMTELLSEWVTYPLREIEQALEKEGE